MIEKNKYVRCKASGQIKRIAYISKEGDVCLESKRGNLHIIGALGFARDCEHLSDCDSFGWQPETFPQWYVCGNSIGWGITAYVVRDSPNTYFCVETNGNEVRNSEYVFEQGLVNSGHWKKVTQAEAESRVKKPDPVESPDDWVTQDRVPARVGIDSEHWSNWAVDDWHVIRPTQISANRKMMHGHVDEQQDTLSLRCRRRDLPPVPEEAQKREYVRLWVNQSCGTVMLMDSSCDIKPKNMDELKHDGTGFYLEDGK